MKRIVICIVLIAAGIWVSVYSAIKASDVNDGMAARIDTITPVLLEEDREKLVQAVSELKDYWNDQEDHLVHFVRHSYIDCITTSVTRLPSLAAYGAFSEVSAELDIIRDQMDHIRVMEMVTFDNLF